MAEPATGGSTDPATEPENAWAGQGSVLLDIGGDVGALVVSMPRSMLGEEVEIDVSGRAGKPGHHHDHDHGHAHGHAHGHRAHVAVVDRATPVGTVPSLVFPDLVEGRYDLFLKGTDEVRLTAQVEGGRVSEVTWPA